MKNFFDWFSEQESRLDEPWLILGKGPSFALRSRFDLSHFNTLSLNHAVREQPVSVSHVIDLDVIDDCAEAILAHAGALVLPWIPHVRNQPGGRTLAELVPVNDTLREMDARQRLLWYHLEFDRLWDALRGGEHRPANPRAVRVRFFSAEAAIKLLAQAGVRRIRSLGIDGGAAYSTEFGDLKEKTLLSNERKSFNNQFQEIAKTIMSTGIDYAPLNVESPIRVYVGSTEPQMLAVKVLEYSIRKHTSMSVEVFPLHHSGIEVPMPKDPHNQPRTPFSFQRFMIPALAGFRGRAVYVDSDMQVFKDMRGLWTQPFDGADLLAVREPGSSGRKPQFSVMLLDCEALRWTLEDIVASLDRGELNYESLMYEMAVARDVRAEIDPAWNSLERYKEGETALLHYTDMRKQPWASRENPLGHLWFRDLFEAVDQGFISEDYIREHVEQGYVRPSLLYQLEHRLADALLLPPSARALDDSFIPPWKSIQGHGASPWTSPAKFLRAAVRHYYFKTPLPQVVRRVRERFEV